MLEFLTGSINKGIDIFAKDIANIYGANLKTLSSIELNANAALNLAIHTRTWADRQLLKPMLYKYPYIIDTTDTSSLADLTRIEHLHNALVGKSKVTKLLSYMLIDRSLIVAAAKKRAKRFIKK